jgi:hypothetical protein
MVVVVAERVVLLVAVLCCLVCTARLEEFKVQCWGNFGRSSESEEKRSFGTNSPP